jgi:putative ABC transport system permease protein
MSKIIGSIKSAIRALFIRKGRATLTILGIVIGIALVIIVMSVGNAIRSFILAQIQSFGSDIVNVEIRVPGTENTVGIEVTTLKASDGEAISQLPDFSATYSGMLSQAVVAANGITKKSMLFGVSADYPYVDSLPLDDGRFFTNQEDLGVSRVAVIGSGVRDSFFPDTDAVGEYIRINGANYRILGVVGSRGSAGFFDRDNIVFLPLRTLQKLIAGVDHVSFISSKLINPAGSVEAKANIEMLMRERHRISDPEKDDFVVRTIDEAQSLVGGVIAGIQILLVALASISLIVGGIGIMNIMYVSVSERTFEIGLRKAIGARNKDILFQFLIESIVVTILGGILGIVLGVGISYVVAQVAQAQGFAWKFVISPQSLLLSVGFSVAVGVLFGLYPARKAAKLEPIVALRYE